jgi:hypothetical protein
MTAAKVLRPASGVAIHNHTIFPHPEIKVRDPAFFESLHIYGGRTGLRGLALSQPGDLFLADPTIPERTVRLLQDHLGEIGLETATDIIYDNSPEHTAKLARELPGHRLSGYSFDHVLHAARPDEKRLKATELAEDKNWFARYFPDYVPTSAVFEPDDDIATRARNLEILDDMPYPKFVKAARTSNGEGVIRVTDSDELTAAISEVGPRYQVQQGIEDEIASLSLQYEADKQGIVHTLAVTQQLTTDNNAHEGNLHPVDTALANIAVETIQPVAEELARLGVSGTYGFDIKIDLAGNIYILDSNARTTGVTTPLTIASALDIPEWGAYKMRASMRTPEDVHGGLNGLTYDPATKEGVIIFNNALIEPLGKTAVVIAGSADVQAEIKPELMRFLNPRQDKAHTAALAL